jgi:ADP-ribosyltransferase exoenzyme
MLDLDLQPRSQGEAFHGADPATVGKQARTDALAPSAMPSAPAAESSGGALDGSPPADLDPGEMAAPSAPGDVGEPSETDPSAGEELAAGLAADSGADSGGDEGGSVEEQAPAASPRRSTAAADSKDSEELDSADLPSAIDRHLASPPALGGQGKGENGAEGETLDAATPTHDLATTNAIAAAGVEGANQKVPHLDAIQQSFGPEHDLSNLRATVGGAAKPAADGIGGLHFAFGPQIAFGYAPSKKEAAHEVAHSLLQQYDEAPASGVTQDPASEERADKIAARVEAGEPVRDLLPAPRATRGARVVQRAAAPGQAFLGGDWLLMNEPGIVKDASGANLRSSPSDKAAFVHLGQNTKVQILKHNPKARWYAVVTATGNLGYVAEWLLFRNLPEPGADVYLIKKGDTPLEIARSHYGKNFDRWGQDLRFVVNALVYVNSKATHNGTGSSGLAKPGGVNESWLKAQASADTYIWLPSANYLNSIYEEVRKKGGGTGSISYDALAGVAGKLGDFSVIPSYVGGLAHGFLASIGDTIVGLFDLVKSIFTGEIIEQMKALWNTLSHLSLDAVKGALGDWWQSWSPRLTSDNGFVRGHAWGYLAGYLCGEIAMFALAGPALNAVKASKLATGLGKVISKVVPKLSEGMAKISKAGGAVVKSVNEAKASVLRRYGKAGTVISGTSKLDPALLALAKGDAVGLGKALAFYKDAAEIQRLLKSGRTLAQLNALADTSARFQTLLGAKYTQLMNEARTLLADPALHKTLAGLTQEEVAAMIGYTSSDYQILNSALRAKNKTELLRLAPYIDRASGGLSRLPNYVGVVYRGASPPASVVSQYVVGNVVEEAAYMSTSYIKGANFPGNVQYTILSKTGKQIDFLSMFKNEKEILFAPGSRFKVLDVTHTGGITHVKMSQL